VAWKIGGLLFGGHEQTGGVSTSMAFPAPPDAVWDALLTYEEVTARPPLVLRMLLPEPIASVGERNAAGAEVECLYREGSLLKRITLVEPPRRLAFDVINQRLGFEDLLTAVTGGYEIRETEAGSEVELSTIYVSRLRPRFFWGAVEQFLGHVFHRHLLQTMLLRIEEETPCTTSGSHSRH
jgi:hypothetical protein